MANNPDRCLDQQGGDQAIREFLLEAEEYFNQTAADFDTESHQLAQNQAIPSSVCPGLAIPQHELRVIDLSSLRIPRLLTVLRRVEGTFPQAPGS